MKIEWSRRYYKTGIVEIDTDDENTALNTVEDNIELYAKSAELLTEYDSTNVEVVDA